MAAMEFNNDCPWLMIKLHDNVFALNSSYVVSILHLTEDVTIVPQGKEYIRGLITFRGEAIKLIDMRKVMAMPAIADEYAAFQTMLEQRKQDHIHWVDELERCSHEHKPFPLATDPHKCAFGQWYDKFSSDINTVNFHMKKIDEPHKALHNVAQEALECKRECSKCKREVCLQTALDSARHEYMPEVLELIEEAKHVFKDHYREMVIAIECDNQIFGIVVDEVIAVEELVFLGMGGQGNLLAQSKLVSNVAKTKKSEDLILLLNLHELLHIDDGE